MKRFCAWIVILATMMVFSACKSQSRELELAVCGAYGAPGMMCLDLKGQAQTCEIMEEDVYGRILFSFTAHNLITDQDETAYIICQAAEKDTVYFYEDICYLFAPATEQSFEALKQANDWNQALNHNKMSARPIRISFDLCLMTESTLDYDTIEDQFCQSEGIEPSQIQKMVLLDVDPTGQELHYVVLQGPTGVENYFLICDLSYQLSTHKTSGTLEDLQALSPFKSSHNWKTAPALCG